MASTPNRDSTSPFNFLGRLLSTNPSRFHGKMGGIYAGMCQELEPQRPSEFPSEAWNASVDPQPQQQRYRSDSDSSATSRSTGATESPTFDIPRWTWPELKVPHAPSARISDSIKPASAS